MPFHPDQIWTLPTRVVLATDLTDLKDIVPIAIDYATKCKAALQLVHVLTNAGSLGAEPSSLAGVETETVRQHAERTLQHAADEARNGGLECTWVVRNGQVADTVVRTALEWNAERLVIGSHGIRKFQEGLLGSAAEAILREVDIPVLTIGPAAQLGGGHRFKRNRFLLATALDRESLAVTESVVRFAKFHHAELTLLHVLPGIAKAHPSALRAHAYAESKFHEILFAIPGETPNVTCKVETGPVVDTILRVARQGEFDLILLGGVSGSSFSTNIMPGTVYGIICSAPCPVLLIKGEPNRNSTRLAAAWQSSEAGEAQPIY